MKKRVLILEDDTRLAKSLKHDFEDHGYCVVIADCVSNIPNDANITHAVIDLRLSGGDFGLDAILKIKTYSPEAKIIVLSGYGSITTAVEAVKRGAIDYLTKPASFFEIEKALNGERISKETDFKRRSLSEVEHEYIDFVLTKNEGNISQTAKDLGLHRQSLQRKLKKYT
jgi:two-component system, response regulator RegA